ncbi:Histone-lysine N-methyltransferase setd3 [Rhynchospora pubera]|uniref:Histone-lysine N-methyltransferase setd3 n=1 Tax=Rhynchospora pubera TaxID=906938 RepID=A0AAV8FHX4_9POAL|nr:Histone-lysine N-methyltransferase setd3 [Rhynchospora pubera]
MLASSASKPFLSTASLRLLSLTRRRSLTCSANRIVAHPPDLVRWVRREGGSVHPNITISDDSELGLSVFSTGEISAGSELIELPSHLPLRWNPPASPTSDKDDSVLAQLAQQIPEELWAMRLGLRLLQERAKDDSFWWPYVGNLPETFTVPIFFSGEDIKNLQYAPLLHQVNLRCRFLFNFEKQVKTLLNDTSQKNHPFGGQDVNSASLGWAMSAVSSRAFRLHGKALPNGSHEEVPMLLPLIDMCNHSFTPNASIVQERDASSPNMSVKVVADKQIEQNTPVTLNYGRLSNDLFLLDYGFVVPSNPYDQVELRYDGTLLDAASMAAGVSSPNFSSPATWQQDILCKLNLLGDNALLKVTLGGPELIDGRLLAALRVLISSDKELVQKHSLDTLMVLGNGDPPLGSSVEVAALRTVIALSVISLEHFPTKIMQDESVLKGDVSSATQLAVQFRMQKKLMLVDVTRKLSQRVKMLSKEKSTA